ncbi:lipopolysaccharide biosynthesis protein [Cognatishimia sp. MH4019]|uniref:lipopolysaccharide biosynthesis protein n=1 Tax=Cognatishimia sp. MH4019 TaxID=2854030 RepID=UPI001CD41AC9|nr:oligosaccharide flippase family protein [Cognatishimia sp. MH4019]
MSDEQAKSMGGALLASSVYRRLLKNAGWLFSTQVIGGLIGILTLTMMARALGPAGLGVVAIVQAYVKIVDRLTRLEPWQAVIRHGTVALENGNRQKFAQLIRASIAIDLVGSLLAGTVALLLASLAVQWLSLPQDGQRYLILLSLGLFVSFKPTGIAILRIFDRFDLLAKIDVGIILLRFALTAIAYWFGLGLWAFIAILLIEAIANGLIVFLFSLRELQRREIPSPAHASLRGFPAENPGFFKLLWNSNINVILRQSTQRFDVIILSAFVDTAAVGVYFLARRLADAALKLARPINQVLYPELVRTWTSGTAAAFRRLLGTVTGVLFAVGLAVFIPVALNMGALLAMFFGAEFESAALLVNVQFFAAVIYLGSIVMNPAMLTVGRDGQLVRITLIGTIAFFILAVPLILAFGPVGLSLNFLLFNLFWLTSCVLILNRVTTIPPP